MSAECGSPKAASKIPKSAIKSRNKNPLEKSHSLENYLNSVEQTWNDFSDTQIEAKVQVPTRFHSREAMMKFGDQN